MAGYESHLALPIEIRKKYSNKWVASFWMYQKEIAFVGDYRGQVVDKIRRAELNEDDFIIFHVPKEVVCLEK